MASPCYLICKDVNGQYLPGPITQNPDAAKTDRSAGPASEVLACSVETLLPVDPFSGAIASKRKRGTLDIVLEKDKTSGYFLTAQKDGAKLEEVVLEFWSTDPTIHGLDTAGNTKYFIITLKKAMIVNSKDVQSDVNKEKYFNMPNLFKIQMSYEEMTWEALAGNITGIDRDMTVAAGA